MAGGYLNEPIYTIGGGQAESPYAVQASRNADPEELGRWLFSNGRIDGYKTKKQRDDAIKAYALSQGADPEATLKAVYGARGEWIEDVQAKQPSKPNKKKVPSDHMLVQTLTGMAQPHLDKLWDRIAHSAIGNKRGEPKMGSETRAGARVTGAQSGIDAAKPIPTEKPDRGMAMTLAGVGRKSQSDWSGAKDQTLSLGRNGVTMMRDGPKGQWKRQKPPTMAVGMPNPSQGQTRKAEPKKDLAKSVQPRMSAMKTQAIGGTGWSMPKRNSDMRKTANASAANIPNPNPLNGDNKGN